VQLLHAGDKEAQAAVTAALDRPGLGRDLAGQACRNLLGGAVVGQLEPHPDMVEQWLDVHPDPVADPHGHVPGVRSLADLEMGGGTLDLLGDPAGEVADQPALLLPPAVIPEVDLSARAATSIA
jgi:hypothetical protein